MQMVHRLAGAPRAPDRRTVREGGEDMYFDNRGTDDVPFGFVYTDDGDRRAWYTVEREEGILELGGPGSGYFQPLTFTERQEALRYVAEAFGFVIVR